MAGTDGLCRFAALLFCCMFFKGASVDFSDLDTIFFSNAGPADLMKAMELEDFFGEEGSISRTSTSQKRAPPAPPAWTTESSSAPPSPPRRPPSPPLPPRAPGAPPAPPLPPKSPVEGGTWSTVQKLASGAVHAAQDAVHGAVHMAQDAVHGAAHVAHEMSTTEKEAARISIRQEEARKQEEARRKAAQEAEARKAARRAAALKNPSEKPKHEIVVEAPESECSFWARTKCNHFERQFIHNQRKDNLKKAQDEVAYWEREIARGVTQTPHGQMRYSTMIRILNEIIAYITEHGEEKARKDLKKREL
eukprot:TRINITY_DN47929_c0_g1_i1.p1 TRINITY_DN47929_c0_g1~~TRINITY_DN47929_c0_g1_i1.p1  ORF type:complete len:315 (+),score=74.25 TRINITY_DN47929_c0_g1_i1:28-945(+)